MLPNEVKPYTEHYQWLYNRKFRGESYQWFRFNLMNMWVDDAYDKLCSSFDSKKSEVSK
jgi:hypothetical protein